MKKSSLLLLIPLIVVLVLSGCVRKASTPPATTPKVIDVANTPLPVDQQILSATMTAQAIMQEFNMPTQIVQNPLGTPEVITQVPPRRSVGTATPLHCPPSAMTKPTTAVGVKTIYCGSPVQPGDMLAINNLARWQHAQHWRRAQSLIWYLERTIAHYGASGYGMSAQVKLSTTGAYARRRLAGTIIR